MGGNAMAPFGAVRHSKEEYCTLTKEVLDKLYSFGEFNGWTEVKSYSDKDSFGDLDIVFTNRYPDTFFKIISLFNNPPHILNGTVMSFLYKDLQVDLIGTKEEDFIISQVYFSYNDLGNLMGKLYHSVGLKYGHNGLHIGLYDTDNSSCKFSDYCLSKDPEKIFRFLGLDYSLFLKGFSTLEEIFKFVTSSRFFSKEIFAYENMNAAARVRDKKRSTYTSFLEYIKDQNVLNKYEWSRETKYPLKHVLSFFPEAVKGFDEEYCKFDTRKRYKENLNGALVRQWIGSDYFPTQQEFGQFMKFVSNSLSESFVLDSSPGDIANSVRSLLQSYVV